MSDPYNPTYRLLIDWHGLDGLNLYDFETGLQGWAGEGDQPPTVTEETTIVSQGTQSMKVAWVAFNPFTFNDASNGFDSGRFGTFEYSNPDAAFTFDDAARGFDTGLFGYAEVS